MSYGALAQAGYFDANLGVGLKPKVYSFKWGRLGWGGSSGAPSYTTANKSIIGTALATSTNTLPTGHATCNSSSGIPELIRCVADTQAASQQTHQYTGSGDTPWPATSDGLYQPVDIRESADVDSYTRDQDGSPSADYAYNIPLKSMFDSAGGYANLQKLNLYTAATSCTTTNKCFILYSRTPHGGIMAAQGARMLGYNAKGMRFGLAMWNSTVGERWISNPGYAFLTVTSGQGGVDNTLPTINSGPTVTTSCGPAKATIAWGTNEPATSMVLYSTTSGGPYTTVNDTVLQQASHSVILTIPVGTYYYIVRSYDANANKVETAESSFTITCRDLYISTLSAPGTASAGDAISVSDTTSKSGPSTAAASTTKIYLSPDNLYNGGDTYLGSRAIGAFGAGPGSSSGSTGVTIPTNACTKTYYLIGKADANNDVVLEWNEGNNNAAIGIGITRPDPSADLYVSSVTAPGTASAGDTISVSDTTNKSGCAAGASTTKIYLSTNNTLGIGDIELGSRAVPAFTGNPAAQSSSGSTSVTIPLGTPSGSYYIIVKADAGGVIAETNEGNNTKASALTIP